MTYASARRSVITAATTLYPESAPFWPSLISRGDGNYQAVIDTPSGEVDGNGVGEEAALLSLAANLSPADAATFEREVRRASLERELVERDAEAQKVRDEIAAIDAR